MKTKSITIGGTFPPSGLASIYAPIARGMETYFRHANSKGGVYGRKRVKTLGVKDAFPYTKRR